MKKYLVTAVAIACCLVAGKLLSYTLGMLPASLYGMILFSGLLATGILNENRVGQVITRVIYYMPVAFLPVCVGVMQYTDLVVNIGWKLLIIGMVTTLLTMLLVGWLSTKMLGSKPHD